MALSKKKTDSLADAGVTQAKIADNAVTAQMISDGTIAAADLASSAVTNAKLSANAVTNIKVDASAAIAASKLDLSTITGPISITRASGIATTINRSGSAGTSLKVETGNVDITVGTLTMNGSTVIANNRAITATAITATGAFTSLGIDDNADATAITIDSSEHVGIGIASPDGTLHVHSNSAGSVTPQTDSDDLVVENSSHGGISVLTPDANRSAIVFGHASDNLKMQIRHDGGTSLSQIISDDPLTFNVNGGTERMRIDSSGRVGIGLSSPQKLLHLKDGDIVVGNGTASNNSVVGRIGFSTDSSNSRFIGIESFRGGDAANADLRFHTFGGDSNNGERMRIDTSGNVGIGNSIPSSFYSLADNLVVGTGSGGHGLTIYSGSSDSGYIGFNDTASASMQGFIQYNHNGDYMAFAPSGSEKMRIDSSGNVTIANGNLIVANGKGISFSATANNTAQSSSMASELLDDYEEGTWTPSFSVTTTVGDLGYFSRQGSYIKIGNQVTVWFYINAYENNASGDFRVNVPFTSQNVSNYFAVASLTKTGFASVTGDIEGRISANATIINLKVVNNGNESSSVTQANTDPNFYLYGTITYKTA